MAHHSLVEPSTGWYSGNGSTNSGSYEITCYISVDTGSDPDESSEWEVEFGSGNGGPGWSVVRPTDLSIISNSFVTGHGTCHEPGTPI